MPVRIQRLRVKGWRAPDCSCGCGNPAIYVGRPTIYGNPFRAYKCDCCGYWDVIDDNGVTYLVDHSQTRLPTVRADRSTWTTHNEAATQAVRLFWEESTYWLGGGRMVWEPSFAIAVADLAGHDLMCWCPLDRPCHADVLLELANRSRTHRPQGKP